MFWAAVGERGKTSGVDLQLPPAEVWADTRVVARASAIDGTGLFAVDDVDPGETLLRLGGRLVNSAELAVAMANVINEPDAAYVDTVTVYEDAHLILPPNTLLHFANHRCEPNLWHSGPYDIVARGPIIAGDELTIDYGTNSGAPGFEMHCRCGSGLCRGVVSSDDWRLDALQGRYRDHWTPALQLGIDRS